MKSLYKVFAMIICLQLITVVVFAASSPEASIPDERIITDSFLQTVQDELRSLNEWGQSEKADPKKGMQHVGKEWITFYDEYSTDLQYDIRKTNSIVSPYMGVVTFSGTTYAKKGTTEEECLNAAWQKLQSGGTDLSKRIPTLKYAYQSGKWILKEKPSAYRQH